MSAERWRAIDSLVELALRDRLRKPTVEERAAITARAIMFIDGDFDGKEPDEAPLPPGERRLD